MTAARAVAGRALVEASAGADVVLRTALSTLLTVPMASWALTADPRRERRLLSFYADLTDAADPERTFPPPSARVRVRAQRARGTAFSAPGGRIEVLRFESGFRALHPQMRRAYARHERNRTAWAQHWRHDDGPRPTLCVIHGFMASPFWLNTLFFSLPWFYGHGYDVLLYVMPFHGPRQPPWAPFSGYGFFAGGPAHVNEAMAQAVHDFRAFVDHLEAQGVPRVGVTGLSLGGYTAALLAAVEPRLHLSIPNAPVVAMPDLLGEWFPAGPIVLAAAPRLVGREQALRGLMCHSPLTYPSLLARERLLVIGGRGDRLAPPHQAEALWRHWGRPKLHWFPGNHIVHINRGAYLREMGRFMRDTGFAA